MKIAVVGIGYVGLTTGICLAAIGHSVVCIDKNLKRINQLQNNQLPFFEPGLTEQYQSALKQHNFRVTKDFSDLSEAEAVFISVGTPTEETGESKLTYLIEAVRALLPYLKNNTLLIIKSTVPPGTSQMIKTLIESSHTKLDIHLVSNPEFLREGNAIYDFFNPDRIVIGLESPYAEKKMGEIYASFIENKIPVVVTNTQTAELIKYASNAFLATKIAYINEIANVCENINGDIETLIYGMGLDHRVGNQFLRPGPGFGGSCFPKDIKALAQFAKTQGSPLKIIEAVIKSNATRKTTMIQKIEKECGGSLHGRVIGILGLTFKANTDDVRESPAIDVISELLNKNAMVKTYDPLGMYNAKTILTSNQITWCKEGYEVAKDANALVIATEWEEFKALDPKKIKQLMETPVVLDFRNLLNEQLYKISGLHYQKIGG